MHQRLSLLLPSIAKQFLKAKLTLATAESCTGGGLSYWITSQAGSSDWFDRGFITYSNDAKITMLGVHHDTINSFGAVSQETACEMALGVLKASIADISIAITGIAGPTGGSHDKPIGTVWIALGQKNKEVIAKHFLFVGDREAIRLQAIVESLTLTHDLLSH